MLVLVAATAAGISPAQDAGRVFVVLGPPGSGKTTQSQAIAAKTGLPIIVIEELIDRDMGLSRSELARLKQLRDNGALARLEVMNDLVRARVSEADTARGFIIDGYPRTTSQARALANLVTLRGCSLQVVVLDVSDAEAMQRLLKRGGKDDTREKIEKRLAEFKSEIDAISREFGSKIVRVNGAGSPAEVTGAVMKALAL